MVVSYPQNSARQLDRQLELFSDPRRTLSKQFPGSEAVRKLAQRDSPSVDIDVLLVSSVLQSGDSAHLRWPRRILSSDSSMAALRRPRAH
jgi:hypothetical protein